MERSAILRVLEDSTPQRIGLLRRHLTAGRPDPFTLKRIHNFTHIINNSYDPQYNLLVYLACGLSLYSPIALVEDVKVKNGVCEAIGNVAGLSPANTSRYIREYVRHYYEKRKGFADMVEDIVERLG